MLINRYLYSMGFWSHWEDVQFQICGGEFEDESMYRIKDKSVNYLNWSLCDYTWYWVLHCLCFGWIICVWNFTNLHVVIAMTLYLLMFISSILFMYTIVTLYRFYMRLKERKRKITANDGKYFCVAGCSIWYWGWVCECIVFMLCRRGWSVGETNEEE